MYADDIKQIRELAKRYAEIAHHPAQAKKRERYARFNDMEAIGPMVLIEPDADGAWSEIIPPETLRAADPFLREYEFLLRRMIYHFDNFHDDQVFEPYVSMDMCGDYTGYHYGLPGQKTAWGISIGDMAVRKDGGSYALRDALSTDSDFEAFLSHELDFVYDEAATNAKREKLSEALDGILGIKLRVPYSVLVCSLLIELVHLRSMTSLMMDLYDAPERMHRLMRHMSEQKTTLLLRLERNGLLVLNNDNVYTGSGGTGYSNCLPAPGFGGHTRLKDIWGFADAQEFALVSNEMFREFVFPYQRSPLELFGLACYGCCESVDSKLDDIMAIGNIWRISVSPWSDVRLAAKIGRRAIYSRKPNPALVSTHADEDAIRRDISAVLEAANNCQVEFVMKDLRTCGHDPGNLKKWVDTAKSLCG